MAGSGADQRGGRRGGRGKTPVGAFEDDRDAAGGKRHPIGRGRGGRGGALPSSAASAVSTGEVVDAQAGGEYVGHDDRARARRHGRAVAERHQGVVAKGSMPVTNSVLHASMEILCEVEAGIITRPAESGVADSKRFQSFKRLILSESNARRERGLSVRHCGVGAAQHRSGRVA